MNKVVLAYSGGLDTSVAVAWLKEQFGVEVVTLTVDLGGGSLRAGVEDRAMSAGASRAYVVDARERFVTDYVWPHLQANALYQGAYPLATALARPLIAQLLVEVAKREGADAVAHGCTGKGNDQVRFDVATHALDPGLEVVAPMRVGMGLTRDQEIDYAAERGIEIPITKASPYSIDVNLWGRSCETGVLEDPWVTPPADAYEWTVAAADAPAAIEIVIDFEGGIPVALDGERLAPVELVQRVHDLGGAHGVGRIDHVEDRLVGIKSREIYETPAATILHGAHRALEGLTLSRDTLRFNRVRRRRAGTADLRRPVVQRPVARPAGYVASSQRVVSGEVRVRLDHGSAVVVGRRSPMSLYDKCARHVRRGRRVRPRQRGRVHRDLRAAAAGRGGPPRRGRQAPWRRLDLDDPLLDTLPTTVGSPSRRPPDEPRAAGRRPRRDAQPLGPVLPPAAEHPDDRPDQPDGRVDQDDRGEPLGEPVRRLAAGDGLERRASSIAPSSVSASGPAAGSAGACSAWPCRHGIPEPSARRSPRPSTAGSPYSQPRPSAIRMTPNATNASEAPIRIARSGSRAPRSAPIPMAIASAATIPAVEPSQTPIGSFVVARVTVASIVLSPSSARKNATPIPRATDPVVRVARSSSASLTGRRGTSRPRTRRTPARRRWT